MNHILRKFCAHHTVPWADKRSFVKGNHCVKSTGIRGFSGSYFPAFRLNTEGYGVTLRIYSEWGKIRIRKLRIRTIFTYFQLHRINRQDVLRPGSDTNSFNILRTFCYRTPLGDCICTSEKICATHLWEQKNQNKIWISSPVIKVTPVIVLSY